MRIKAKHQRLALIALAILAVLGAILLAMWGLKDRAAYFYTPTDVAEGRAEAGRPIRIGGMVEQGSIERLADGVTIRFLVGDGTAKVPVRFRGIAPDLFREGSGAVAEGRLSPDGVFIADNILAKHDERYMPPELGNTAAGEKATATVER